MLMQGDLFKTRGLHPLPGYADPSMRAWPGGLPHSLLLGHHKQWNIRSWKDSHWPPELLAATLALASI